MLLSRMSFRHKLLCVLLSCSFIVFGEACGREGDAAQLMRRLSALESDALPLPYHDTLLTAVPLYEVCPLPMELAVYGPMIDSVLDARRMPEQLLWLPMALSGMRNDSIRKDRSGCWALTPLVALHQGLAVDSLDERFSVRQATSAALDFLSALHAQYGDWWSAVLAYANSPMALTHAGGVPEDLWQLLDAQRLPDADIIRRFIACICAYEGKPWPDASPEAADSLRRQETVLVNLQVEIQRRRAAEAAGQARVEAEKAKEEAAYVIYVVRPGDTLGQIAQKHHVKLSDLKQWNNLKRDLIRDGQKLKIYR